MGSCDVDAAAVEEEDMPMSSKESRAGPDGGQLVHVCGRHVRLPRSTGGYGVFNVDSGAGGNERGTHGLSRGCD